MNGTVAIAVGGLRLRSRGKFGFSTSEARRGDLGMNVLTSVVALRYPPWELSNREGAQARQQAGRLVSLMWLPVGFYAAEAAMAGDLPWLMDLDGWLYLAALAPGGVPLALACGRLRLMGYPGAAWMAFGVLAPVTVAGSGYVAPLGVLLVAACAAAASLPAWLLYGLKSAPGAR